MGRFVRHHPVTVRTEHWFREHHLAQHELVQTCMPLAPGIPGIPLTPLSPFSPLGPVSPLSPTAPKSPLSPFRPNACPDERKSQNLMITHHHES
jgi:hypothetical protein